MVGDPFEPELAAAAAGATEQIALTALDELLTATLIRQTDVPRRFRFRHPLLRRAVYQAAPAGWLLGAHERSAAALALRGGTAADLPTTSSVPAGRATRKPWRRCARPPTRPPIVLRRLQRAGTRRRCACFATTPLPTNASSFLLSRAGALASCGHFAEGYDALLECIELVPEEAVGLRVRLTTACAGMEHLLGRHDVAHRRLAATLEGLADTSSPTPWP